MKPQPIPKASAEVVRAALNRAVESGSLWMTNGPASILAEPIPSGVLTEQARIQKAPAMIAAAEILPENLPQAWSNEEATGLSIAAALSQKFGQTLPWKTVSDVIAASLNARFTTLDPKSEKWPCTYPASQGLKLRVASGTCADGKAIGTSFETRDSVSKARIAFGELSPAAIQDLGDMIPQILEIKNKANIPLVIKVRIEIGDSNAQPDDETIRALNALLENIDGRFRFEQSRG